MKTIIDFKDWYDFPRVSHADDFTNVTTLEVKYKDKFLNVGDTLLTTDINGTEIEITVDQIRLNPTLRVWDNKTGMYYLVLHCNKVIELFENYC